MRRFFCVHGHFYQPPRENPWTGRIERQPSAGEDHDWNRRIARECYLPNGEARVVGGDGRPLALVNNYASMSFNFGPTLLSWLEDAHPEGYLKLVEADRESARRLDGHGNAVAQAYSHMILPLACRRDRATQVAWGIADFRHRFGRDPEAMWIPETACNDEVLRVLIDFGLKFAILAPAQARRARPVGRSAWTDVSSGGADPRRPYLWVDRRPAKARSIALFFYHGALSHAAAFGKLMASSRGAADRVEAAFDAHGRAVEIVSICTDGETYGHHEKFAEMGLAHLLRHELPARGVPVVNFGWFLAHHRPSWEVEIQKGPKGLGTSWSCAHGVARWRDDCGCGSEGKSQRWRGPLREALDSLRERLAGFFEREGGTLLRDPWEARDDYIRVVLDPGEHSVALFLAGHLKVPGTPTARRKVLALMEMQRHAMLMYTSCGWFFAEISGLEAAQNLRYAARAIELAREAGGPDLEPSFVEALKAAPSNDPHYKDGAGVWRKLVRRSVSAHHSGGRSF